MYNEKKKFWQDTKDFHNIAFKLDNLFLIFSLIMFSVYLVAPLFSGIFSLSALVHYGSWVCLALVGRLVSQRKRKGLRVRAHECIIFCVVVTGNFLVWFSYPVNIILSILGIAGSIVAYRAQGESGVRS